MRRVGSMVGGAALALAAVTQSAAAAVGEAQSAAPVVLDGDAWSAVSAAASFFLFVYTQYLSGPRLSTQITQVTLLRLGALDRVNLFLEILLTDIASSELTPQAQEIVESSVELSRAVQAGDRGRIRRALEQRVRNGGPIRLTIWTALVHTRTQSHLA